MNRRTYLAAVCGSGVLATAGCSALAGDRTLSDPAVTAESSGRKALVFTSGGEELGHFGVDGFVDSGRIDLSTEIWHREGTEVTSIDLRLWMPETTSAPEVAVVSPVEGDSSPPPSVALYSPDRSPGTAVRITDLDDLADETISTLELLVEPASETATTLAVHSTIELTGGGLLAGDYTLDGELRLEYPALDDR